MGLDITAYRGLTAITNPQVYEDGSPRNNSSQWIDQQVIDWTEDNWPGRSEGLSVGYYVWDDTFGFCAGSYSGYNHWRQQLARYAGYESAEHVWHTKPTGPFVELIDFADNEGFIGPIVSKKLARDFSDHKSAIVKKALSDRDEYFIQQYLAWEKCFEVAAEGGCVEFH